MRRRTFLGLGIYALGPRLAGAAAGDAEIVACAIHPALGIARVGNSPEEGFLGPEVPGPDRADPRHRRDSAGRIRRQGVRFRIFGLDAAGRAVRELTSEDARITWRCELANAKSAWYDFVLPLDLPEAVALEKELGRRNPGVRGRDRDGLVIRPGPRSLEGPSRRAVFDGGRFLGLDVPLGEARTDELGRLTVFGGFGTTRALDPETPLTDAINNDGWHDDTSDGPVDAQVVLDGRNLPVRGAWVVCGPPAFAPGITPLVTLYDRMMETSSTASARVARPSFARHVFPTLERLARHQWVNAGFARDFGRGSAHDFLDPALLARLADPGRASRALRREVFSHFRRPDHRGARADQWPPYYGDHVAGPRSWMALLPSQYRALRAWAEGSFEPEWPGGAPAFAGSLDDVPMVERPAALDRAQLDAASGGPFHPGIECGWVVRARSLYAAPLRFRRRAAPEPDFGELVHPSTIHRRGGPLDGLVPGGLTRWLGVPWQTDTSNCLSAYEAEDPYLPSFWPAFAPNDVFTEASFEALRSARTEEARRAALDPARREHWIRGWDRMSTGTGRRFLATWHQHGIVVEREGPPGGPDRVWVETGRSVPEELP